MKYTYVPVKITDREPELENLFNDRLIQLDENFDVVLVSYIGLATEWEAIKHREAIYWLEKQKTI